MTEPGIYDEWNPRPFRVLIEDYDGGRVPITVNAIGKHDARHQAEEKARDLGYDVAAVLRIEEAA